MPKHPKTKPLPGPALLQVRARTEQVTAKVEQCADELSTVNEVLKVELKDHAPTANVDRALDKSADIEVKVQECADELAAVTVALTVETDERAALGREVQALSEALVTSRTQERQTRLDAQHDPLTGLPNLTLFNDRLKQGLAQARRHGWQLAVVFLDVDQFKRINDTHGHDVGDGVLELVAQRLKARLREGDTVCRRSGDEFLLLMLEVGSATALVQLLTSLRAALGAPAEMKGVSLSVSVSMGAALFPNDGHDAPVLLAQADAAMYAAKRLRSGPVLFSAVPPADAALVGATNSSRG